MKYSTENLTTILQCEALASRAVEQRKVLTANLIFAEHAISKFLETRQKMEANFDKLTSELASMESISKALESETEPYVFTDRKNKLQYRLYTIETARASYNVDGLLEKELKLATLTQQAVVIDEFIGAIEKRKASLKKKV